MSKIKQLLEAATSREMYDEGLGGGYWEDVVDYSKFANLVWNAAIDECIAQLEYKCANPKEPVRIITNIKKKKV